MNFESIKRNRALRSVLLVGLALLLLAALVVWNGMALMETRSQQQLDAQLLESTNQQIARLEQLRENEKENRDLLEQYQKKLPQTVSQDALLRRVEALASEYEVSVESIGFAPQEELELLRQLPFSITLSGSYAKVMQFVEELTFSEQVIQMESLALAHGGADADTVSAQAEFTAYYQ